MAPSPNISEIRSQIARLEKQLLEFRATREDLRESARGNAPYTTAFAEVFASMYEKAVDVLAQTAIEACTQSGEYNHPVFKNALLMAIRTPGTIELIHKGGLMVEVRINLDRTAGELNEYANAVKKVRELKSRLRLKKWKGSNPPPENSPDLASDMWREKIYSVDRLGSNYVKLHRWNRETRKYDDVNAVEKFKSKYWETIMLRFSYFTHYAPWWRLLDGGNAPGSLASDVGGTPFPSFGATNFVNKAVRVILIAVEELMATAYKKALDWYYSAIVNLTVRIRELEEEIKILRDSIIIISDDFGNKRRRQLADELLRKQLKEQYEHARPERIQNLLDQLEMGVKLSRSSLGSYEGKRIRPRLIRLIQELEQELKRGQ